MLNVKENKADIGCVIARFQVHELHPAHRELINTVKSRHSRVFVFLGVSVVLNTLDDPLDFRARKAMLLEEFPDLEIFYIKDIPGDDERWSKKLDDLIRENKQPMQTVTLYGSRDSFLKSYKGVYPVLELESTMFISGTEVRKQVRNNYPADKSYRAGMIAATAYRYPTAYQTVDVAIINQNGEILLAKKPNEKKLRFIGGFSDPRSDSLETDAIRETKEEANVAIGTPIYIGSTLVNDPRYHGVDRIKTALFVAPYIFGRPCGGDDVESVEWRKLDKLTEEDFVDIHKPLFVMLRDNLKYPTIVKYNIDLFVKPEPKVP